MAAKVIRFHRNHLDVMMRIVVVTFHLFVSVSCLIADGVQSENVTSLPLTVPITLHHSGPMPWGDGGSRGQVRSKSTKCESRGKCSDVEASAVTSSHFQNCFCDRLCSYYDDCCQDYRPEDGGASDQFVHLPSGVATCQRFRDFETGNSIEVYRASRCPRSFSDPNIRRLCEAEVGPATTDRFLLLPVTGNTSLMLYKNLYCAICAGELHPVFWLGKLRCGLLSPNGTHGLREIIRTACPVEFAPVREWGGGPGPPRRCTVHIGRCDRDWKDDHIRRKCRSATNYVFAGNRAFRNKHCAECNYVNETYLRCDDVRPITRTDVIPGGYFEQTAASVVTLDFNRGRAVVMETVPGSDYVIERRIDFPTCSADGSIYDPFAGVCREIKCLPEMNFPAANCFLKPETMLQSDRAAEESVISRDDDQVEGSDRKYDVISNDGALSPGNFSAVAMTTLVTMTTVATDLKPMRARFALFHMDAFERLLSFVGTMLCLLFLSVFVVLSVIYEVLRTDPANRYAVCFSVCLLVAHLLFAFVVFPTEHFLGPLSCFCLSVVLQYAYITAFFWLNVMSIDVFKRLTANQSTVPEVSNHCSCFTLFSLYAWMVPAFPMAAATAIAVLRVDGWDQLYDDGRAEGCFVLGLSQLLLFLVPVTLVVTTNVAMYVIVTCRICFERRPIRKDPEHFRQAIKDRKRFVTCVQLTVVMTTTWVMALMAHLTELTFLWYLFIVFDAMQGMTVAVAFVFKVKVWHGVSGRSRSVTITKRQASDGASIEPFADPDHPHQGEVPVVARDTRLVTVFRETSI